jgi:uncharacterized membrane protein YphA (DoxX/SURF4 family)
MATAVLSALDHPTADARPRWRLLDRLVFRFVCSYFLLYSLPQSGAVNLIDEIPGGSFVTRPYIAMWHAIVSWVAVHVFHLTGPVTVYPPQNGSGDTTLDYIQVCCYVALATVATVLWSILDRRRNDYARLHSLFRGYLRYLLALTLFGYGFAKVIPMQFPSPRLSRLIEPYGDSSPMGLLWTFMGYSAAYTIFSGLAEVTGGALLLFRRTATLGALVSAVVLTNIVMLNFCYDVPVKIYSVNLLLMALIVATPDLGRIANVLVLNRPVSVLPAPQTLRRRWMRIAWTVFKVLFVGAALFMGTKQNWEMYNMYVVEGPKIPLYGLYEVESFTRNGQPVPPLLTDSTRWKKVIVERPGSLWVRMMDDSPRVYNGKIVTAQRTISFTEGTLTYMQPDDGHVALTGKIGADALDVKLRKVDTSKLLLLNRGFHWINERPFNR